jgi:hypothetical protein
MAIAATSRTDDLGSNPVRMFLAWSYFLEFVWWIIPLPCIDLANVSAKFDKKMSIHTLNSWFPDSMYTVCILYYPVDPLPRYGKFDFLVILILMCTYWRARVSATISLIFCSDSQFWSGQTNILAEACFVFRQYCRQIVWVDMPPF